MSRPLPLEDLEHVLAHTGPLWEELRGRRIFITGGTGFFGMWLLESFAFANAALNLGARAVVLTRDEAAFARKAPHLLAHDAVKFFPGDVRNFPFRAGEFSHVIHAATTSSAVVEPGEMLDTIIAGTRRALDFAVHCGARKFLLASSGAVYGRQPADLSHISETYPGAPDPSDPKSAYGEGKRVAELLCAIYRGRHGLETKVARCFAFAGPWLPLDAHFAFGNFIRDALAGGPIKIGGDGTPLRSYLYAADLAIWLWTILFQGTPGRPYNVGSEEALSISELAERIHATFGLQDQIGCTHPRDSGRIATRYVPATNRAQEELSLHAWTPIEDMIAKTASWNHQP